MISAKLKLIGVNPEALSQLHKLVSQSEFSVPEKYKAQTKTPRIGDFFRPVTIENSKMDEEHKTYTVSLSLEFGALLDEDINHRSYGDLPSPRLVAPYSLGEFLKILRVVEPDILPENPEPLPMNEIDKKILTHRKLSSEFKAETEKFYKDLNKLVSVGKVIPFDIFANNGDLILQKGKEVDEQDADRILHRLNIRGIEKSGLARYIDLDKIPQSDFKDELLRLKTVGQSLAELEEKLRILKKEILG